MYKNKVVGELGKQTLEIVVVVWLFLLLSLDVFAPTSAHPLLFLDKGFVQIPCIGINMCSISPTWKNKKTVKLWGPVLYYERLQL